MYVLEEILGRISASFPDDRGRFTCTCMHMNTSIQINNECAYFTIRPKEKICVFPVTCPKKLG